MTWLHYGLIFTAAWFAGSIIAAPIIGRILRGPKRPAGGEAGPPQVQTRPPGLHRPIPAELTARKQVTQDRYGWEELWQFGHLAGVRIPAPRPADGNEQR